MGPTTLLTPGLLILLTVVKLYKCTSISSFEPEYQPIPIPDGFKLGVATAAFQVEGAWNVSGRSESIWDAFTRIPGAVKDHSNANDACKSYYFWQRDIEMLKYLGVNTYRFSMSWTRLLPTGRSNIVNPTAVEYYNNIIDALIDADIEPMVTVYHWDLPNNLQLLGGWANPLVADWLEDFARVLFDNFGDRVKTWITLNEPIMFGYHGYGDTKMAPGLNARGIGEYIVVKNMLMAHARVYHLYNNKYRKQQRGKIGIVNVLLYDFPKSDSASDKLTASDAMLFDNAMYLDPIFSKRGGFPERVIELVAERSAEQGYRTTRFPQLSPEEIDYIKGTSDFLGVNFYHSNSNYTRDNYYPGLYPVPSLNDDLGAKGDLIYQVDGDEMPTGIRHGLLWLKDRYDNPKILITENGYLSGAKGLLDEKQLNYQRKYLYTILHTTQYDGVNVIGYIVWSLMDVFEWNNGYTIGLGLFKTDFSADDRKRSLRLTGAWYRDVIAMGYVDMQYMPDLKLISF